MEPKTVRCKECGHDFLPEEMDGDVCQGCADELAELEDEQNED